MTDPVQLHVPIKPDLERFVEDMVIHGIELLKVLREQGDRNDIKDRITCLKYLEDVTKTYFILKKASEHDPDAAGSTVRKYASAFSKGATGVGEKGKRGRKPAAAAFVDSDGLDGGGDGDDPAAA